MRCWAPCWIGSRSWARETCLGMCLSFFFFKYFFRFCWTCMIMSEFIYLMCILYIYSFIDFYICIYTVQKYTKTTNVHITYAIPLVCYLVSHMWVCIYCARVHPYWHFGSNVSLQDLLLFVWSIDCNKYFLWMWNFREKGTGLALKFNDPSNVVRFCAAWKHKWPVTTSKNPGVQTLWFKHQRMKLLTMMFCSVRSILRVPMFNSRRVDGELDKSMLLLALGPGSCGCTCAPGPCWGLLRGVLPLVHLESGRYQPWKWFLQNGKKPHDEFHSRMVKCQSMMDGFGYEMLMGGIRYRFMSCHVAWFHGCMNRHRPGGWVLPEPVWNEDQLRGTLHGRRLHRLQRCVHY